MQNSTTHIRSISLLRSFSLPDTSNNPLSNHTKFAIAATVYIITYITVLPLMKAITEQEIEEIIIATERIPFIKPIIKLLLRYEAKIVPK